MYILISIFKIFLHDIKMRKILIELSQNNSILYWKN